MRTIFKKSLVTITMSILMIPFFTIPVYAGEDVSESGSEILEKQEFVLDIESILDVDTLDISTAK